MNISSRLRKIKCIKKARTLSRFFKTKKGDYGEGDLFLGITIPQIRCIVDEYGEETSLNEVQRLLKSRFHEERLTALLILIKKYESSSKKERLVEFYLKNLVSVNNWDLVDLSAPNILGNFLLDKSKRILYQLSKSENLWGRRIAIVSTLSFIRKNNFEDTLKISEILLGDEHDLIKKAVGWMLREVGKRNLRILEKFIEENHKKMSRTTLRYSIEKMSLPKRQYYLTKQ